jgi:hypothetical protein
MGTFTDIVLRSLNPRACSHFFSEEGLLSLSGSSNTSYITPNATVIIQGVVCIILARIQAKLLAGIYVKLIFCKRCS